MQSSRRTRTIWTRLPRKHIHPVNSVFARSSLFGGRPEAIKSCCNTHAFQTDLLQISNQLCLRQSAGDSTGPQIDTATRVLGKLHVKRDIGQVQPATRLQRAHDFCKSPFFLRHQIENAVRNDDIDASISDR